MGGLAVPSAGLPGVTTYATTAAAMRALGRAARYAAWRAQPRSAVEAASAERAGRARARADRMLEVATAAGGWLAAPDVRALLGDYDLAPVGRVVHDPAAAAAAAGELACPSR